MVVQAIELNEVGVSPVLFVYGFQVTVVPLTVVIEMIKGTTVVVSLPVPMPTQNVVLLHAICVSVLMVIPDCVK